MSVASIIVELVKIDTETFVLFLHPDPNNVSRADCFSFWSPAPDTLSGGSELFAPLQHALASLQLLPTGLCGLINTFIFLYTCIVILTIFVVTGLVIEEYDKILHK